MLRFLPHVTVSAFVTGLTFFASTIDVIDHAYTWVRAYLPF